MQFLMENQRSCSLKTRQKYDNVRKRQGLGKDPVKYLPELKIAGAA